jgi:dihydroneopterin aldolase
MSDLIRIIGVKAKGFHGVLESERRKGQKFIVDVELKLSFKNLNDELNKTVNYAEVAQVINDEITGAPQQLIESLANNIAAKILKIQCNWSLWFVDSNFHRLYLLKIFKDFNRNILRQAFD